MRDKKIKDWKELADLAYAHKHEHWIYRGVQRQDHELIPSIGRKDARAQALGLKYSLKLERLLLSEFQKQARPLAPIDPQGPLEWMALGQHHGLMTRLLDWTESLYVAAFFATEKGVTFERTVSAHGSRLIKEDKPVYPAIYGVRDLPFASDQNDPFEITRVMAYRPAHISPRIAPQLAAFTIHPNPARPYKGRNVVRWTLEIGGTIDMREALDAIGISRASLFPGIDGMANSLNWKYKWDRLRT